jgi:hypothetical protein
LGFCPSDRLDTKAGQLSTSSSGHCPVAVEFLTSPYSNTTFEHTLFIACKNSFDVNRQALKMRKYIICAFLEYIPRRNLLYSKCGITMKPDVTILNTHLLHGKRGKAEINPHVMMYAHFMTMVNANITILELFLNIAFSIKNTTIYQL